jgi:hypothetical protein
VAAGGTQDKCSGVAVPAFTSLLADGGVCDQQNAADSMIDLAKQLGNDPEMIRLAQLFVQQPRNSVSLIIQFLSRNWRLKGAVSSRQNCRFHIVKLRQRTWSSMDYSIVNSLAQISQRLAETRVEIFLWG